MPQTRMEHPFHTALQTFASTVTAKMAQLTTGSPEDQLRAPFETFMAAAAQALGWNVVCTGETPLPDRLGRPDYAVHLNQLLAGYVELKAPGIGATASRFKGHNRDQFRRFAAIPNLLYTDGNEWALYRDGKPVNRVVRLSGDVTAHGGKAATPQDVHAIENLLRDFLSWQPFIPTSRVGEIYLKGFAAMLAPLCRMLRDDVIDALKRPDSPLVQLARDWRQLLFPDASDDQFADDYAQTVTFALLLGRSEDNAETFALEGAEAALAAQHSLLARALQVLTDPAARASSASSVRRAIWTATPSAACASICAGSATMSGFSTSAARDAAPAGATTSLPSRRPLPSPLPCALRRRNRAYPPRFDMPASTGRGTTNSPPSMPFPVFRQWPGRTARLTGRRRFAQQDGVFISVGRC